MSGAYPGLSTSSFAPYATTSVARGIAVRTEAQR